MSERPIIGGLRSKLTFDLAAAVEQLRREHEQRVERISRALVCAQLKSGPRRTTPPLHDSITAAVGALAAMTPEDAALAVALVRAVPAALSTDSEGN